MSCTLSTNAPTKAGYCRVTFEKKTVYEHRLAYCQATGVLLEDIKGMVVCHTCDTPACVNPDHLFLGTQSDNMADCRDKGRLVVPKLAGEKHPSAKLTDSQVRQIRKLYASGLYTQTQIGNMFGVRNTNISMIVTGTTRRTA